MLPQFKKIACTAALGAGFCLLIPTTMIAQDQDHHDRDQQSQDQHRDWSNNRYYQMGMQEGRKDHDQNRRKSHHHKFHNDEDRQAYQAGYDNAWQGDQDRGRDQDRPH